MQAGRRPGPNFEIGQVEVPAAAEQRRPGRAAGRLRKVAGEFPERDTKYGAVAVMGGIEPVFDSRIGRLAVMP